MSNASGAELLAGLRAGQLFDSEPTLNQLVQIFEAAKAEARPGDEFAANPALWPDVRGIMAVRDAVKAVRGD